jgi:hypothetical protein
MTTKTELDEILAEIGREHRAIGAPEGLKAVLFAAADGRKDASGILRLKPTLTWAAALVTLAVLATAGVTWQIRKGQQPRNQLVRSVPGVPVMPDPVPPGQVVGHQNTPSVSAPVHRARSQRVSPRHSSTKQPTWASLDEFVPLPVSEGLPSAIELSVVRVKLRASDLQQYGLEAPADTVTKTMLAEFVVGEDGLPRAIRIVR